MNLIHKEKVVLAALRESGSKAAADWEAAMVELRSLALSAGVEVVGEVTQARQSAHPRWLFGKGKVQEIAEMIQGLEANVLVCEEDLSGGQVRNLEESLDCKVIDRTQLILDIFAQRALTKEGMLQVELAQLQYMLPRLAGNYAGLSRLGGGIGTRGPGETQLETDRRHIARRIGDLKKRIAKAAKTRKLQREHREDTGVFRVALVGYTNAGKSTWLRALTGSNVGVENKLFSTLDPTTRRMSFSDGTSLVITDTVGFIRRLPHFLVAAFRSTLESVLEADLIIHVVDASSPDAERQCQAVDEVLLELKANAIPRMVIWNKADVLQGEPLLPNTPADAGSILLSANQKSDIEKLRLKLYEYITAKG